MAEIQKSEPQGHETSSDLKMRIEQMQDAKAKAEAASKKANVQNEPVKTKEPQAQPGPEPKGKTAPPQPSVDLQEWAKAKGIDWTSDASVLEALRKSDQEFHKRREEKLKATGQNASQGYQQPPQPTYQPPQSGYQAPQVPQLPQQTLVEIGRQYNMAPEDVERLLKFNRDQFEIMQRGYDQRVRQEIDAMKRDNSKNSVFVELSSDPIFRRPEVLQEWHRTVEEMQDGNPHMFEDPNDYRQAYDRALANIARRNLQANVSTGSKSNIFAPPTNPPRPIGTGGEGAMQNESELTSDQFKKLDVDEKRRMLDRMGLVESKY